MRTSILLPLCTVALAAAANHPDPQVVLQDPQATVVEPDEYLIELSPGETRWIKEDEKWELRRVRSPSSSHESYNGRRTLVAT
jgi:leucyl aminopeptidase